MYGAASWSVLERLLTQDTGWAKLAWGGDADLTPAIFRVLGRLLDEGFRVRASNGLDGRVAVVRGGGRRYVVRGGRRPELTTQVHAGRPTPALWEALGRMSAVRHSRRVDANDRRTTVEVGYAASGARVEDLVDAVERLRRRYETLLAMVERDNPIATSR